MQTFIFTVSTDQGLQMCWVQRRVIVATSSLLLPVGGQPSLIHVPHRTRQREQLSLGQLIQRLKRDEMVYEKRLFDVGTLLLLGDGWEYVVFDVELKDLHSVPVNERPQSGATLPPPDPDLPSSPVRSEPFMLRPSDPPPASEAPETTRPGRHSFLVDTGPRITQTVREHVDSHELAVEAAVVQTPRRLSPPRVPTGTGISGQYPIAQPRSSPSPFRADDITPAETPAAIRSTPMAPRVSGVPRPEDWMLPEEKRKKR